MKKELEDFLLKKKNNVSQSRFSRWYQAALADFENSNPYFIAEIGINHNGSTQKATELIQAAARAGADAVKFQTFHASELVNPEVEYMAEAFDIFSSSELSFSDYRELQNLAGDLGLDFFSSPFSPRAVHFLQSLDVPVIKIASGDINNALLLRELALTGKPLILSTGASTLEEVDNTLRFLHDNGSKEIVLLHCLSEYPAALEKMNWRSIPFLRERYQLPIGFSDHTVGISGAVMAFALGARIFEKHFTLSKSDQGADHNLSADEKEFQEMVSTIRKLKQGLGKKAKEPSAEEKEGNRFGRRGLYYNRDLVSGSIIHEEDLIALRPQNGFSPWNYDLLLGKKLMKDVVKYEPVSGEDFQTELL